MTKHRRTKRRSQKGGLFGFGESSDPSVQQAPQSSGEGLFSSVTGFFTGVGNKTKDLLNKGNDMVGQTASNVVESARSLIPFSSDSSSTEVNQQSNYVAPANSTAAPTGNEYQGQGGRRRRRARSMKGGKGGLGLTYYAAPVSDLKVAEPTTWQYYANGTNQYSVKGGSRKRRGRKSRRTRRHRKH